MKTHEIEKRLAEIADAQAEFDARDLDAELSEVIAAGGNIDALEEQHLQAERIARRLRVERQTLEAMLPAAQVAEAQVELGEARKERDALRPKAQKIADDIDAKLAELEALSDDWVNLQVEVRRLDGIARKASAAIARAEGRSPTVGAVLETFSDSRMRRGVGVGQSLQRGDPNMRVEDLAPAEAAA